MSAIAGIYYCQGKSVNPQHLLAMNDMLAHRGKDDFDIWQNGSVGLTHRMLWTTPESLWEKLPFASQGEEFVITADARIDNREELIRLLEIDSTAVEKITDSQLILASYQQWGEACVNNLIGDFAFAIWDQRKQQLFCARDHLGIKPFYYYHSKQAFIFASEIKGIFCVPDVPRQINETKIGDFLASLPYDKEITFYQNILKLPPAHYFKINHANIELKSYWSLNNNYELKLGSDREYSEKFKEIFEEAVRCRLRSAFPIGSMLSGGLDSSSITCTAKKILQKSENKKIHTFSFIFDSVPKSDERSFIDSVISLGDLEPHYIAGDRIAPFIDIEKVIWHQDEPLSAPNLFLNWRTYHLADSLGVRVVLDGFDGDTVVSHGVGYLRELATAGNWLKLLLELRGFTSNFRENLEYSRFLYLKKFWFYFNKYGIEPCIKRHRIAKFAWRNFRNLGKIFNSQSSDKKSTWAKLFNDEFIEKVGIRKRRKTLLKQRYDVGNSERQKHFRELNNSGLASTLETLNKSAASFSVELRHPFLDKRLVEFCLSLPPEQKMHRGWTRMILRRAMEGVLPDKIQWRGGKGNLGHNFDYVMRKFESEKVNQLIDNSELIEKYINTSYFEQITKEYLSNTEKVENVNTIWKVISFYQWLESLNKKI